MLLPSYLAGVQLFSVFFFSVFFFGQLIHQPRGANIFLATLVADDVDQVGTSQPQFVILTQLVQLPQVNAGHFAAPTTTSDLGISI